VRFLDFPVLQCRLTAKYTSENGLSTVTHSEILGGQKALHLGSL
jgi:hypothetical protein